MARPRPCPAPVTSTVVPASCRSMWCSSDGDEAATVAEGDDPAVGEAGEVGGDDEVGGVDDLADQGVAHRLSGPGVDVEGRLPVGLLELDDRVRDVADEQCALAPAGHDVGGGPGGVARGGAGVETG